MRLVSMKKLWVLYELKKKKLKIELTSHELYKMIYGLGLPNDMVIRLIGTIMKLATI